MAPTQTAENTHSTLFVSENADHSHPGICRTNRYQSPAKKRNQSIDRSVMDKASFSPVFESNMETHSHVMGDTDRMIDTSHVITIE